MTEHNKLQKIRILEEQYAEAKKGYEKWVKENANLAGSDAYKAYVSNFSNWEKTVQDQLKEARSSLARQPVSPLPQVPSADLDTQLKEALEKAQPMEFMMAIFQMSSKNPSFMPTLFQNLYRITGVRSQPPNVALNPGRYTDSPQYGYGYASPSTSAMHFQPQTIAFSQQPTPTQHTMIRIPNQPVAQPYTQYTPYGAIPGGWTVDKPVQKPLRPPSPIRSYEPAPMPFRDFSQK